MNKSFEPLNMDFSKTVISDVETQLWVPSPGGEVQRCQFERQFSEKGWANSLVRYPIGANFPEHGHPGGEQFLVLEGIFSDHRGDFGPGSFIQNPIGYRHSPRSVDGCLIFVRLGALSIEAPMLTEENLFKERVKILKTDTEDFVEFRVLETSEEIMVQGMEIFIVEGELALEDRLLKKHSWGRVSCTDRINLKATLRTKIMSRPIKKL